MSGRVEVKICGLSEPAHAEVAAAAGADYVGVVFAERLRRVGVQEAARVVAALEGSTRAVGVFVDASPGRILSHRDRVGFRVAQLHGHETPAQCETVRAGGLEVWKALRPTGLAELLAAWDRYGGVVDAILVEGYSAEAAGGTGTSFPYEWLDRLDRTGPRLALAGGLDADVVGTAIARARPDIVDVSSGVEASPGEKSPERIVTFIEATRAASAPGERIP